MSKIKEMIKRITELSKDLVYKFPATIFIIAITTLFITICIDSELDNDFLQMMVLFLFSFFAGSFFIESVFKQAKTKIITFLIAGGISIFFGWYLNGFLNVPEYLELLYIGYILVLMLMAIYFLLKKSKLTFQEYLTKVFSNLFFVSIVYSILSIGVSLVCLAFVELILNGDYDDIIVRVNLLVFGFYFVIGCLYSVSHVDAREINIFIKSVVKFVLMPLVGIASAIIYLYILKIFITGEIPSNVIFRICAFLFVFAFPIWNMYEVIGVNKKIPKIFAYAYLPFLLLEIYSLGIRIASLGLTPLRYFGIFFFILQTIALVLSCFWDKNKLPKLILCSAILVALYTMTPFTPSMISSENQLARLTKYMPDGTIYNDLNDNIKEKVASAYKYLIYDDYSEKIPEHIKNQQEDILNYTNSNRYEPYSGKTYYSFSSNERINVSGYDYITKAYSKGLYDDVYNFYSDLDDYKIDKDIIDEYVRGLLNDNLISNDNGSDYFEDYKYSNSFIIDDAYLKLDDMQVFFTNISIYYDSLTDEFEIWSMEAYILE